MRLEYLAFNLYLQAGILSSDLNYIKLSNLLNQQGQNRITCFYNIYDFLRKKIPLSIFPAHQDLFLKDLGDDADFVL